MLKFVAIFFIVLFSVSCSSPEPEIITVVVTATSRPVTITLTSAPPTHTPTQTSTPQPTSTPEPTYTPTRTPRSTSTRVPTYTPLPVSTPTPTNNDCIDCPLVVPGKAGALRKYEELPASKHHEEKVLLVVCGRGHRVQGLGEVMGGRRSGNAGEVFVKGSANTEFGECVAITAQYDGIQEACRPEPWDTSGVGCSIGRGKTIEVVTFKKVGQITFLTTSEYNELFKLR